MELMIVVSEIGVVGDKRRAERFEKEGAYCNEKPCSFSMIEAFLRIRKLHPVKQLTNPLQVLPLLLACSAFPFRYAKRYSEVELFNGALIAKARKHGIAVPTTEMVYQRVKEIEAGYEK